LRTESQVFAWADPDHNSSIYASWVTGMTGTQHHA
jgi:hypothetical protein